MSTNIEAPASPPTAGGEGPTHQQTPALAKQTGRKHRLEDVIVVAALLLCHVVAYPRVFLQGEVISPAAQLFYYLPWRSIDTSDEFLPCNNVLSDEVDSMIPTAEYMRNCILHGNLPAWSDAVQNGTPLFWAITHHMILLPMLGLVLLLGTAKGITAFVLLRQIVGGLFFFKYCRIMGLGRWAAICGAIVFTFGSFPIQTFGRALAFQLAMLPISLYAIERIIRDRSLLWVGILPFLLHFNIVSGFPAGTAYCLYFLSLYAFVRVMNTPGRRIRLLGLGLLLGCVAILLSAPALLATVDYFSQFDWGYRGGHALRVMPPGTWLTFFFPFLCGPPTVRAPVLGLIGDHFWWFEHCIYIGALPVLVVLANFKWRKLWSIRLFYLIFAVWLICLFFNVGGILHALKDVPVFGSNPNTRQKVLFFFILAMWAAWALDDLTKTQATSAVRLRRVLLAAAIATAVSILVGCYHIDHPRPPFVVAHLWVQGILFGVSALLLLALLWRQRPGRVLKLAVVALVFLDLQLMDRTGTGLSNKPAQTVQENLATCFTPDRLMNWNPTIPSDRFFPVTPGIRFLQANTGEHQILTLGSAFLANGPLYYGVNNLSGRAFTTARQKEMYRIIAEDAFLRHATQFLFSGSLATRLDRQFVDALGIKYVVLDAGQRLDDMSREYLIRQKEWNYDITLTPGEKLVQPIKAPRTMAVDRLTLRCREFALKPSQEASSGTQALGSELLLKGKYLARRFFPEIVSGASNIRLQIEKLEDHTVHEWSNAEWHPETGTIEFDLGNLAFEAGQRYSVEIGLSQESIGKIRLLCTKDAYILQSGSLVINDEEHPGELTFALFRDMAKRSLLQQMEWNDSFTLKAGESASQTFVAKQSLRSPRVAVRLADNRLQHPNGLHLTVTDLNVSSTWRSITGTWCPAEGNVVFNLDEFLFETRHRYQLEIAVDESNDGEAIFRCTKGVDLIPSGQYSVQGEARDGDMTLSVCSANDDLSRYHVVHTGDMTILENTAVFGRAFLVGALHVAEDEDILAGLRSGTKDLRQCAWVSQEDADLVGEPLPPLPVVGEVEAIRLRNGTQRFRAKADAGCYLIVRDNYHPHWRAWIDGQETPIFRANYNMRGLCLPAGEHMVDFRYQPPYHLPAVIATLLSGVVFLAATIGVAKRRARINAEHPSPAPLETRAT